MVNVALLMENAQLKETVRLYKEAFAELNKVLNANYGSIFCADDQNDRLDDIARIVERF